MEIKRARKGERRIIRCRKEKKIMKQEEVKDRNMMKEKENIRKQPESQRDN
jgi:hypothetical protein